MRCVRIVSMFMWIPSDSTENSTFTVLYVFSYFFEGLDDEGRVIFRDYALFAEHFSMSDTSSYVLLVKSLVKAYRSIKFISG